MISRKFFVALSFVVDAWFPVKISLNGNMSRVDHNRPRINKKRSASGMNLRRMNDSWD